MDKTSKSDSRTDVFFTKYLRKRFLVLSFIFGVFLLFSASMPVSAESLLVPDLGGGRTLSEALYDRDHAQTVVEEDTQPTAENIQTASESGISTKQKRMAAVWCLGIAFLALSLIFLFD